MSLPPLPTTPIDAESRREIRRAGEAATAIFEGEIAALGGRIERFRRDLAERARR